MVFMVENGEVVGHTATPEMWDVRAPDRKEGPYSWTEGNRRDLVHQELIARGGFSEVHKIKNLKTGWVFARKLIRVFGQVQPKDIENEARVLSELGTSTCPYIVEVLGHGWLETALSTYFIDMEFCPETLDERVRKTKVCDCLAPSILVRSWKMQTILDCHGQSCRPHFEYVTSVLLDIVSGLIYIHEKGIVHRDLKPLNVLYSSVQRRWQLCDFGTSATATSKRLVVTSSRRGTGGYRAPEVLDTGVYNNKSDQFSLGCIAFELTFGTKLFRDDYGVLQFSHNPEGVFSTLWPRFHPHNDRVNTFKQIVFSLLAIDPRPRPSASETKVTLNSIYESIRHEEQESMDHHHSTVATFLVVSDNFSGGDVFVGTDGIWGEGGDGDRDGDGDGDGDGDWCLVEHKVTVLLKAAEVPLDIGVEV